MVALIGGGPQHHALAVHICARAFRISVLCGNRHRIGKGIENGLERIIGIQVRVLRQIVGIIFDDAVGKSVSRHFPMPEFDAPRRHGTQTDGGEVERTVRTVRLALGTLQRVAVQRIALAQVHVMKGLFKNGAVTAALVDILYPQHRIGAHHIALQVFPMQKMAVFPRFLRACHGHHRAEMFVGTASARRS